MNEITHQLKPVEVVRDQYGFWTHPVLSEYIKTILGNPEYLTEDQLDELKNYFNIEVHEIDMDVDAPKEIIERYWDKNEKKATKDWVPSRPDGEGWFLVCIHSTNDGCVAWWARPKMNLPEVVVESLKEVP